MFMQFLIRQSNIFLIFNFIFFILFRKKVFHCISIFHIQEVESEGVEIIFVSSDRSPEDMVSYMKESHGDWLAVPHGSQIAQGLKQKFDVSGIPCLVVLKGDGTLITKDGRGAVTSKGPAALKDWK